MGKRFLRVLVAVLVGGSVLTACMMNPPTGYTSKQLIFDDQFQGTTLDTTHWDTYLSNGGGGAWNGDGHGGSGGSPNGNNAAYFQPSGVSVNNGLNLTATRGSAQSGYSWTSGVVTTDHHFAFTGGYVQVSAQMPAGAGMWPGIWMLNGAGSTDPHEIDNFEGGFTGTGPPNNAFAATLHDDPVQNGCQLNSGTDLTAGYHTYGMRWVPGASIQWFLDGTSVCYLTGYTVSIPTGAMELILSLYVGSAKTSGWRTPVDSTTPSPSVMHVAEVQVYSN